MTRIELLAALAAALVVGCGAAPMASSFVTPVEIDGSFEGRLRAGVVTVEGMASGDQDGAEGEICVDLTELGAVIYSAVGVNLEALGVGLLYCEVFGSGDGEAELVEHSPERVD